MNENCPKVSPHRLLASATLLVSAACSGGQVDIGDEGAENSGGGNSKLSAFAGSWDGEIELWHEDAARNRVRIELDATGNGSVRFGDSPIESAPDHPYPTDADVLRNDSPLSDPLETALYPVRGAAIDDGELEFFVELGDLFQEFCAEQADPTLTPPCVTSDFAGHHQEGDACIVSFRGADDSLSKVEMPCTRAFICYHYRACQCADGSCSAVAYYQIHFKMKKEGSRMTGEVRPQSEPYDIDFD